MASAAARVAGGSQESRCAARAGGESAAPRESVEQARLEAVPLLALWGAEGGSVGGWGVAHVWHGWLPARPRRARARARGGGFT